MLSALKHRFKNVLTPPHLTIYHAPMLSVAAIHATLLAIFLGVLSTYGFYRRTVSDQLEAKLKQEAHEINTIRFKTDDYIPKQAITEAKQLRESTPLPDLVEKLRVIILYGENVKSPYSVSLVPDNEVATLGRDAFHFMLALVLHSPFPDAMESRSDPSPIPFPDITTIESWVGELEQVTTPLIRAYESARSGLSKVLQHYSLQNAPEPLSPEYISGAFGDSDVP